MKLYNHLQAKIIKTISQRKQGLNFLTFNILGNGLTFLLNFTLPLILDPESYGYFALMFSIFNLSAAIFSFGLDSSMIKFAIERKNEKGILQSSYFSWLVLALPILIIISQLIVFVTKRFEIKIPPDQLMVVIVSGAIIAIQRITLSYYIGIENTKKYGILFISNKLIQFLLFIIFLKILEKSSFLNNISNIFLFQSLIVIAFIFHQERKILFQNIPVQKKIKEITIFTLPLTINTIGNLGYSYGFNIFVSPFLSLTQLGILNIYTQLSSIAMMSVNALNNGYIPKFYTNYKNNSQSSILLYAKYILQNAAPLIIITIIIGAIYKHISFKNSDDYNVILLTVFCLGLFLYSFKSIGSNIMLIHNKTSLISTYTVLSSTINIAMAMFMTKQFGFTGCIYSLSLGYLIQVLLFNVSSFKVFNK